MSRLTDVRNLLSFFFFSVICNCLLLSCLQKNDGMTVKYKNNKSETISVLYHSLSLFGFIKNEERTFKNDECPFLV